jgi:chromosome segregation ATPase
MARLKLGLLQLIQSIRAAGEEMAAVKQSYDLRYGQLLGEKEDRASRDRQDMLNMEKQLARLQEQMQENNQIVLALEQSLAVSRDKISVSDKFINELQEQLQTQKAAAFSASGNFGAERSLREERERLLQDKNALEIKIVELREAHEFLQQKEKILQKELTRSRTEAMGFRRICEGYKTRLEKGS